MIVIRPGEAHSSEEILPMPPTSCHLTEEEKEKLNDGKYVIVESQKKLIIQPTQVFRTCEGRIMNWP